MKPTLTCQEADARGLVSRYLARTLPVEEEAEFEEHYLTCQRCQAELRLGAALRSALPELRGLPGQAHGAPTRLGRRLRVWGGAAAVLMAAGIAAVYLMPRLRMARDVERLGAVASAPPYTGIQVRAASPSRGDSLFSSGMEAYSRSDYLVAATRLRGALAAGADPIPANFFLGASLLLAGEPAGASAAFAREIALGDSPYLTEAHYYRAKAVLALRRPQEALQDLAAAAVRPGPVAAPAAALADSVKQVLQR